MSQNRGDIDFVHDINLTLFACDFGMPADNDAIQKFIAHFASEFGCFKIFLYVPYKSSALCTVVSVSFIFVSISSILP